MPFNKEGRDAFKRGVMSQDVPYDDTERRVQWVSGWCQSKRAFLGLGILSPAQAGDRK
jgi:hypothetical protein